MRSPPPGDDDLLLYGPNGEPLSSADQSAAKAASQRLREIIEDEVKALREKCSDPDPKEIDQAIATSAKKFAAMYSQSKQRFGTEYNPYSGELYLTMKVGEHSFKLIRIDVHMLLQGLVAGAAATYAVATHFAAKVSPEPTSEKPTDRKAAPTRRELWGQLSTVAVAPIRVAAMEYPKDAVLSSTQGTVVVELTLAPEGEVIGARVVSGIATLDDAPRIATLGDAAKANALQWKFVSHGPRVGTTSFIYRFQLKKTGDPSLHL